MAEYQIDVPIVTPTGLTQVTNRQDLFYNTYFQTDNGTQLLRVSGVVNVTTDLTLDSLYSKPQFKTVSIGIFNYSGAGTLVVQTGLNADNGFSLAVTKLNDATLPVTASITANGIYQVPLCGEYLRVFATGTATATVTIEAF